MRIGALGAARITPRALVEPAAGLSEVEVVAVAARDPARARAFAEEHGIARVHDSYAALLDDDELDAIYVALPPSEHASWSIAALEAGRHVLVEKPFARNADEALTMVEVAERAGRVLFEAFHWRFHPLADRLLDLSDAIRPLARGEAVFRTRIAEGDIRRSLALGGGSTMDLGCYPVHWLRTVGGEEPAVVSSKAEVRPPGVDVTLEGELRFPSGWTARLASSMEGPDDQPDWWLRLEGAGGTVFVDNPCAPHLGHRLVVELAGTEPIEEVVEGGTTYAHQLVAFVAAAAGKTTPLTGGTDAVANMAVIDALYRAAGLQPR